jgi:hypothetical protein
VPAAAETVLSDGTVAAGRVPACPAAALSHVPRYNNAVHRGVVAVAKGPWDNNAQLPTLKPPAEPRWPWPTLPMMYDCTLRWRRLTMTRSARVGRQF